MKRKNRRERRPFGCALCKYTGFVEAKPVLRMRDGVTMQYEAVQPCRCRTGRGLSPPPAPPVLTPPPLDRQRLASGERERD